MKRTKIVCTIGPSSHTVTTLEKMIRAGMNVARLNFSHGSYSDHAALIALIRSAAKRCKTSVAILQDLQGPRVRVGVVPSEGIALAHGEKVILVQEGVKVSSRKPVIPVQVALHTVAKKNVHVLIQDGTIDIRITAVKGKEVSGVVVQAGTVHTHKGINVPGVTLPVPAVTAKDIADAQFGISQGVDFVALSFVKDKKDIQKLRAQLPERSLTRIIAKIERAEAIQNIDEIIDAADGIMVARGDLGVEMGVAVVPTLQKEMIEKCIIQSKVVIVATQMLESMTNNPRPTRAEASDVANAVLDQTDAVMLSAESASGKFPVQAVRVMSTIARVTERADDRDVHHVLDTRTWQAEDAVAHAAVDLALESRAKAIVVVADTVDMLARVSRFRPKKTRILFMTTRQEALRQAQLYWGVEAVAVKSLKAQASYVRYARAHARALGIRAGQRIVVVPAHTRTQDYTEELLHV